MARKIAVIDLETDPFEYGKVPEAFASGYFDGDKLVTIWDDKDVISKTVAMLQQEPPAIIYAHNGGRFDIFYFLEHLHSDLRIVNGRIIQARLGEHELRDSFAIMPFALRQYNKDDIDYRKLHRKCRDQHRAEILSYLESDCKYLHELCVAFHNEFGDNLTIGGTAMKQLKKRHKFICGNADFDKKFRNQFYYGGRVQVFQSGVTEQPLRVYDVNSMYPHVMRDYLHPVGTGAQVSKKIEKDTCFVVATGENYGAFPTRTKTGGLDFTVERGTFSVTIHEWNAALETGSFRPHKIVKTYGFNNRVTFAEFVDHFYAARKIAKQAGDKARDLFYKFVLNSAYGKFAQNPENYYDYQVTDATPQPDGSAWEPAYIHQGKYIIWKKPAERHQYYNVATGASITGAARAVLLRGISNAYRPIYCDTDSIICESMRRVDVDSERLGAWKLECQGTRAAIAGKKLYAIFDITETCIKKAHKGARLTGEEILRIAKGEVIACENPVPRFGFDGSSKFMVRNIRSTASEDTDTQIGIRNRRAGKQQRLFR
jgi:DNA polymerase elongation subunit (family B)